VKNATIKNRPTFKECLINSEKYRNNLKREAVEKCIKIRLYVRHTFISKIINRMTFLTLELHKKRSSNVQEGYKFPSQSLETADWLKSQNLRNVTKLNTKLTTRC
jgi:kynurenine formamidase